MAETIGYVLIEGSPARHVEDLHPAADPEQRESAFESGVRERDLVARPGGDEFVVVLTDLGGHSGAVSDSVERIRDALNEPFAVNGLGMALRAAVGVATFPADACTAADLLAHADRAMYVDKGARNGTLR